MPAVAKRLLYIVLGLACTGLGTLGVWLPGLPTVPFILVALWAFSRSSKRLHNWLVRMPLLRQAIHEADRFQREGTIQPKVKLIAQGSAWLSCVVVTILTRNTLIGGILLLLAVSCSVFMYITPSPSAATEKELSE